MGSKEEILDRARELWSRRGYQGAGIQELSLACGLSKPALYHHWGSKAGILEGLVEAGMGPYREILQGPGRYTGDIVRNLNECALAWFAVVRAHPDFARLRHLLQAAGAQSEEGQIWSPRDRELEEGFIALFEAAAADHGNMGGRALRYAASWRGFLDVWSRLWLDGKAPLEDQDVYPLVHQFMHGIFS